MANPSTTTNHQYREGVRNEFGSWQNVTTMEEAFKLMTLLEEELARTLKVAQSHADSREKAQRELDNLRQVAEDVNTENDMIVNDMQQLYKENDKIHQDLKSNRDVNAELEHKIERLQIHCEELQDRIEACHGQAVDPEDVQEAVKQLRSTGNKKLKEAAQERKNMEEMVDDMREELNEAREKMLQLVTEKDEMIRKYKSMQKKLKRCGCQGHKLIQEACAKSIMSDDDSGKRWRGALRKHLPTAGSTGDNNSANPPKVVAIEGNKQQGRNSITRKSKGKRFSAMGVFSDQTDNTEPKASSPQTQEKESFRAAIERANRELKNIDSAEHLPDEEDVSEPGDPILRVPKNVKMSRWGSKVFD